MFAAVMEHCKASGSAWTEWLLKQHYYEDEQVRVGDLISLMPNSHIQTELLAFLRRYKMVAEETLFCLHRNRLGEAKALLPETKGDFIPSLVQNFEMVQPSFLIGKPSEALAVPATSVDVSMSEAPADTSLSVNPAAAASSRARPVARSDNVADLFSPIKPVVPSSPYTPSLFPPGPQLRQPPRSGTRPPPSPQWCMQGYSHHTHRHRPQEPLPRHRAARCARPRSAYAVVVGGGRSTRDAAFGCEEVRAGAGVESRHAQHAHRVHQPAHTGVIAT